MALPVLGGQPIPSPMSDEKRKRSAAASNSDSGDLATSHTTSNWKVLGELNAEDGSGVLGHNTATTGGAIGVEGVTDSGAAEAAGVRGSAAGDSQGVVGRTYQNESDLPSLSGGLSAGVFGKSDRSSGIGVVGWSTESYGVFGRSDSASVPGGLFATGANGGLALKVNGETVMDQDLTVSAPTSIGDNLSVSGDASVSGHASVSGDLSIGGSSSVGQTGASVYLSADQTVPGSSTTAVQFDSVEHDDFGGMDTSTGEYTVPADGDYHVSFHVRWADSFSTTIVRYRLFTSTNGVEFGSVTTADGFESGGFSRTVFGMSAGHTINVDVRQSDSLSKDLDGNSRGDTFMTIYKVG